MELPQFYEIVEHYLPNSKSHRLDPLLLPDNENARMHSVNRGVAPTEQECAQFRIKKCLPYHTDFTCFFAPSGQWVGSKNCFDARPCSVGAKGQTAGSAGQEGTLRSKRYSNKRESIKTKDFVPYTRYIHIEIKKRFTFRY